MSVGTKYNQSYKSTEETLESVLKEARKKVGHNVYHYLPNKKDQNVHKHHFEFDKDCRERPDEIINLIRKLVLDCKSPKPLAPKQRAPRGSRKGNDLVQLNPAAVQELLRAMQNPEDKQKLEQARTLLVRPGTVKACAKRLVTGIKKGEANEQDWLNYKAAVAQEKEPEAPSPKKARLAGS